MRTFVAGLLLALAFVGAALAQQPVEIQGRTGRNAGGFAYSPAYTCNKTAIYDAGSSGSTQLVALSADKTVYICGFTLFSAGTVNVKLITGTGTACATGSADVTPAFQLTAQTGAVDGSPFFRGLQSARSGALCLNTSAGVPVQAIVYYLQF